MKGFIVFLLMLSSCEKIFSQKDSVVTNIVQPKSITDVIIRNPEDFHYYRVGDEITISGKTYMIKVTPKEYFITIPPPIITYDTVDVIMLVTDTAYGTSIFTDNMGMGLITNRKDVYAMGGYLVTKKIDKGSFSYSTENVCYLDLDKTPVKNKIIWMSIPKPKNDNCNENKTYYSPPIRINDVQWIRSSPNK